jgi:hypothetical protein
MIRKRWRPTLAAVVGLLLAVPPAYPQTGDSVTGTLANRPLLTAQVDAHSGPSGESPGGTAGWHVGGGLGPTWNVTATCLAVVGRSAVVGVSGTESFGGRLSPVAGLIRIVDGGGLGSGLDSFEWALETGPPESHIPGPAPIPGPTVCTSYPAAFAPGGIVGHNIEGGDFVVVDAQPTGPTTKEQCNNGGWQAYGIFKNQGDCVSFVATGGKNPPAGIP